MLPTDREELSLHRQSISVLHIVERISSGLLMRVRSAAEYQKAGNWHCTQCRLICLSQAKPCTLLQVDRNEDMIRSALRAVDSISRIPNVDARVPFKQLMQSVVLQEPMAKKFNLVRTERAEAEGAFSL